MATEVLPDEAPDMTVTELHVEVLSLLVAALRIAFHGRGLILTEIFLRTRSPLTGEERQVSADALVIGGLSPGKRRVYRVPDEPVPDVTIEVLSTANRVGAGRLELERKRDLFGALGVPVHIEIEPDPALPHIDVWTNTGDSLALAASEPAYDGPDLGGLRLGFDDAGEFHVWLPDGDEYLGPEHHQATVVQQRETIARQAAEIDDQRAESERQRAESERQRAENERQRAELDRLAHALRQRGIDPEDL